MMIFNRFVQAWYHLGAKNGMWQEAKRQERAIRSAMVNYKKRAERRRDYYEKIKQDPIKFLRVYGRPSKIHYDVETAAAAENPRNMVPWVGDKSIIIDRFDVRSNLDIIEVNQSKAEAPTLNREALIEERMCNYERYRCLVQNDFASISEEMILRQIEIEEKFGGEEDNRKRKEEEERKKKLQATKAAIGYVYDDSTDFPDIGPSDIFNDQEDEDSEADSDMDIDVEIDPDELTDEHRKGINKSSYAFGMKAHDFLRLLRRDKEIEDEVRRAKQLEEEKAQFSTPYPLGESKGKKSRRERRILKEQRLRDKHLKQPPKFNPGALGNMYTTSDNPFVGILSSASSSDSSRSGSVSPTIGRQQFITSFGTGAEDGEESPSVPEPSVVGPQLPFSIPGRSNPPFRQRNQWRRTDDDERIIGSWKEKRSRTRSRSSTRSPPRNRPRQPSRSRSRSPERRRGNWLSRNRPIRRSSFSRSRSRSRSPSRESPSYRRRYSGVDVNRRHIRRRDSSRSRSRSSSSGARRRSTNARRRSRSSTPPSSRKIPPDSTESSKPQSGPGVIKRYYRPELEEKSSDSASSDEGQDSLKRSGMSSSNLSERNEGQGPPSGAYNSGLSSRTLYTSQQNKMTPQEKLKLKLQLALSKTHLADKKAEKEKLKKIEKERKDRDEEMRQMVVLRRQRERERRRKELEAAEGNSQDGDPIRKGAGLTGGFVGGLIRSSSSSSSSSSSRSRSSSDSDRRHRRHRSRTRSRSPSPRHGRSDIVRRSRRSPLYDRPPSTHRDQSYSIRSRGYNYAFDDRSMRQSSRPRYSGGFADRHPSSDRRRDDINNSSRRNYGRGYLESSRR